MTFEELEDLFLALEINLNPSTFHGLLCGQLCWNDEKIDSFMTESADIFSISSDRGMDADQSLRELYDEIYLNLKNSNFAIISGGLILYCALKYNVPSISTPQYKHQKINILRIKKRKGDRANEYSHKKWYNCDS